ncbi:MAG: 4Fe-4S dicluster domain-containing protein [Synergistaceae bacterium]|nr:4Fe-4S dicluster domain-containing protein [Synergistaceae bacterium]
MMIEITINGIPLKVEKGTTILHAAQTNGIDIPALCNHEGLSPEGNCRVCSVEIEDRGSKKIVASCMFPITGNISVETESERAKKARKTVLQLLVNRNPKSPIIQQLCSKYDVKREERFAPEPDLCIRCGRCVRACEANGTKAIELVGRGFDRHVATPYELETDACIGCLSCATVCPTGKITYEESPGKRNIWHKEFDVLQCKRCGIYFATKEMLDWAGRAENDRDHCDHCQKYIESVKFLTESQKK